AQSFHRGLARAVRSRRAGPHRLFLPRRRADRRRGEHQPGARRRPALSRLIRLRLYVLHLPHGALSRGALAPRARAARRVHLGGTRDPYLFTGLENMWVNFGRTQCHLPSRAVPPRAEVLRGTVGLVVPSLEDLEKRLTHAGNEMKRVLPEAQTKFSWARKGAV